MLPPRTEFGRSDSAGTPRTLSPFFSARCNVSRCNVSRSRGPLKLLGSALGLAAPLLLLAQLLTSCGSDGEDKACNPGDLHTCTCQGDPTPGTQTCKDDGSGYNECSCGATAGTGGSGGGSGTGGSGGGAQSTGNAGSTSMPAEALYPGTVGRPCTTDANCAGAPEICLKATDNDTFLTTENPAGGGPQGGYCSLPCQTDAECQAIDDISACNTALGVCFALCIPGQSSVKCGADRAQVCYPIREDNTLGACIPRCTSDAACGAGRFCDPGLLGLCEDAQRAGGKIGDACAADADCASNLCLEYSDPNGSTAVIGSFCSANCTFGLADGCGFDDVSGGVRQAGCFQAQLRTGAPGDIGFCFPVCDTNEDCVQAGNGWVCDLFNDVNAEQQVGRKGECLPAALASAGVDAGPG